MGFEAPVVFAGALRRHSGSIPFGSLSRSPASLLEIPKVKGILVSCSPKSMVLSHPDTDDPDTNHILYAGCKVFLGGAKSKLDALKPGDEIEIADDGDPVTEIKATRGVTVDD